jgi:hypothetical protein
MKNQIEMKCFLSDMAVNYQKNTFTATNHSLAQIRLPKAEETSHCGANGTRLTPRGRGLRMIK